MATAITNRPGSVEEHLILQLWGILHQEGTDVTGFFNMLETIVMPREWTSAEFLDLVGELGTTPAELLQVMELKHKNERPPFEAGSQERIVALNALRRRVRDLLNPALAEPGAIGVGRIRVDTVNSNCPVCSSVEGGNSKNYLLRRLKRDRPDLAERVLSGELKAATAAREAGFRRQTHTIPHDPQKAAALIRRHFSESEVAEIARLLHWEKP